jgi:hypothetical protein
MDMFLDWAEGWLSRWPDTASWVAAASTLLTFGVAMIAAVYAKSQVDHARRERRDRDRPFVTISLQPSHSIVANIVIKNEGATLAKDVRFSFDPAWESSNPERTKIKDSKIFRDGIPNLVPGQETRIFADMFPDRHKTDLPTSYRVEIGCEGAGGARYEEAYTLDFNVFHGYSTATLYDVHDVAYALRKMNQRMSGWTEREGGPLRMVSRDGDKADAEGAAEFAEWQKRIAAKKAAEVAAKEEADGPQPDTLLTSDMASDFHPQHPITRAAPVQRDDPDGEVS